jgi:SAM-dependent methyltransferase
MNIRERILGTSAGYWSHKRFFSADSANSIITREYLQPQAGEQILDVGCGVGDVASHVGDATYVGVDQNPDYIARAQRKSDGRARFINASVEELPSLGLGDFDKVVIIGVLHHLADDVVAGLMADLTRVMKPDARLIVAENAWTADQATTARVLIALDRGRNVREPSGYERLIGGEFDVVRTTVRHDLLRFPYTYVIFEAVKKQDESAPIASETPDSSR